MRPEHLDLIPTLSTPAVHPEGEWALVPLTRPVVAADRYSTQLWRVSLDDGAARLFSRGHGDHSPSFTPDGDRVLFLREDAEGRPQLALVDAAGGEPWIFSDAPQGVREFVLSPDGAWVAFSAGLPEDGRGGTLPDVAPPAESPRRFTDVHYQANGAGYLDGRAVGLYLLPMPTAGRPFAAPVGFAAREGKDAFEEHRRGGRVLGGRNGLPLAVRVYDAGERRAQSPSALAFGDDGASLSFLLPADPVLNTLTSDLLSLDLGTVLDAGWPGSAQEVSAMTLPGPERLVDGAAERLGFHSSVVSGGAHFLLGADTGEDGRQFVAHNDAVFAVGQEGHPVRRLSDPEPFRYVSLARDVPGAEGSVLAVPEIRGSAGLHRVHAGGEAEVLLEGEFQVQAVASGGDSIVVAYSDAAHSAELGLVTPDGVRRLSDFSAELNAAAAPVLPVELVLDSRDGYPVHGWAYLPEGPGPHPVLLNIHGGPYADYGWGWFDEAQTYVGAGYAVLQCNPRGAAGYGQEHGAAIQQRMGTVDMDDVLSFLEGALRRFDTLDPERLGVMGGSYGGYLTSWITAHDHRFTAAIVERGFLDPVSFQGTSDIGSFFGQSYVGTDPQVIAAQSPMAHVDEVRTPTLVIHSEQDLRCPLEQGQRWFAALQANGVESELLVFPGETHELTRSGRPRHRRERFDAVLEWWHRHLPVTR